MKTLQESACALVDRLEREGDPVPVSASWLSGEASQPDEFVAEAPARRAYLRQRSLMEAAPGLFVCGSLLPNSPLALLVLRDMQGQPDRIALFLEEVAGALERREKKPVWYSFTSQHAYLFTLYDVCFYARP